MRLLPLVIAALSGIGCGGATSEATSAATSVEATTDPATITAGPPQLAEAVVAMEPTCAEGQDERCDALDSDCDGRIDEGCEGVTPGALDVAVAWNGDADLDVILEGPSAAEARAVRADGACTEPLARIERRTLERAEPGRYAVGLRAVDACGGEGPVTASVTVSVGDRVIGTFNRQVTLDGEAPMDGTVDVLAFEVE